jgi:hypothetical protein
MVLKAVIMKSRPTIFWHVTPSSLVDVSEDYTASIFKIEEYIKQAEGPLKA